MTEQTINLRKGLQAEYYLATEYADTQRNILKDHSGYGRQADIAGGMTIGSGDNPRGFESTSLDGSDDTLFFNDNIPNPNEQTVAVYAKLDETGDTGKYTLWESGNFGESLNFQFEFDKLAYRTDNGATTISGGDDFLKEEWHWYITTHDSDGNLVSIVDDFEHFDTVTTTDSPLAPNGISGDETRTPWPGQIAYFGHWDRVLSDAEIIQLTETTGIRSNKL